MRKLHVKAEPQVTAASCQQTREHEVPDKVRPLRTVGKKQVLGWKEFVMLPELGDLRLLAKLDTGARTSALNAIDLEFTRHGAKHWVTFDLPDIETSASKRFRLPVAGQRKVKSSIGNSQVRPVVLLVLALAGQIWTTEVTLTDRSEMELPMLVGRSAMRGRFVVDPARTRLADSQGGLPHAHLSGAALLDSGTKKN